MCFVANLKKVNNVNNQTMFNRFNIDPLVIMHNLKATILILKQDWEEGSICMLIDTKS
uniref:1-aminocyclopropane-1-carboxylate oxidase n=1 Tax=Solanum tuberosum TaxID=4113 RepID=M1BG48_SOLTU